MQDLTEKTLDSREVYNGRIIRVRRDEVLLPGGGEEVAVDSRLCVAETVIVGQVPQTWFQTGGLPAAG